MNINMNKNYKRVDFMTNPSCCARFSSREHTDAFWDYYTYIDCRPEYITIEPFKEPTYKIVAYFDGHELGAHELVPCLSV